MMMTGSDALKHIPPPLPPSVPPDKVFISALPLSLGFYTKELGTTTPGICWASAVESRQSACSLSNREDEGVQSSQSPRARQQVAKPSNVVAPHQVSSRRPPASTCTSPSSRTAPKTPVTQARNQRVPEQHFSLPFPLCTIVPRIWMQICEVQNEFITTEFRVEQNAVSIIPWSYFPPERLQE